MELITLISLFTFIATLLYIFSKWKFSYWKDRNVYHLEPTFFYGNIRSVMKSEKPMVELVSELYDKAKAKGLKYCGMYSLWTPQFIPIDMELIKCIVQKDFEYFVNHDSFVNQEKDPLTGHLFSLKDAKWRNLRAKLTPTFTSGKMKMMFQTMVDCTNGLQEVLKESATINDSVDIKDILGRFTTDVIGSVAFGLEINSMKNPDSEFRKYGLIIFENTLKRRLTFIMSSLLPKWFSNAIGLRIFSKDTENFYMNLVKNTVDYRERNNVYRKDFMHLLIQLKNLGRVTDGAEGISVQQNGDKIQGLTINEMAAQVFVFFLAGFETSATTMTFALLELAQNQEIQEKAREEINTILKKHDNKVTYEAIMEMEFLEKIVLETLRKHPPLPILPRVCNKDYKVGDSDLIIKTGTKISIPIFSIQRDPEYYPNPEKFDPERFNEENTASRPAFTYMPFGEGPRMCIGLRFGKLQTKVGLCSVLRNYKVTLNEKTVLPIKYEIGSIISVKEGVWLNLESLNQNVQ